MIDESGAMVTLVTQSHVTRFIDSHFGRFGDLPNEPISKVTDLNSQSFTIIDL